MKIETGQKWIYESDANFHHPKVCEIVSILDDKVTFISDGKEFSKSISEMKSALRDTKGKIVK